MPSSLIARHEGHDHSGPHYANIKYGYIALVTASSLLILAGIRTLIGRLVSARAAARGLSRRQRSVKWVSAVFNWRMPLPVIVLFWVFFTILFCTVGLPEFTAKKLAKRAGRITYAMVPVVLALALKIPGSAVVIPSYLDMLTLHKWIARVVLAAAAVHVITYLAVYISTGRTDKIKKKDNMLGLIAAVLMAVVAVTSLKPVRRRAYRLFYFIHYPAAWLTVVLIIFHARPGVMVLAVLCLFILFVGAVVRVWVAKTTRVVSVTRLSPTLSVLVLPRRVLPVYFEPGSHVRMGRGQMSLSLHPYTVASLPSDSEVRLLVRDMSHPILPQDAAELSTSTPTTKLLVTGPYLPSGRASRMVREARCALIFAGGSGLSFAAGVARALEMRGAEVQVVWMVRRREEITALGLLEVAHAEVYVTGEGQVGKQEENPFDDEFELDELLRDDEEEQDGNTVVPPTPTQVRSRGGDEGDEEGTLVAGGGAAAEGESKGVRIHEGRPDLRLVANEFFQAEERGGGQLGSAWVCACGPAGLVSQAQRWAGTYYEGEVEFVGEEYVL